MYHSKIDLHIINKFAGTKYGMMSMKVILTTLIRTFVFKVNQTIEIDQIKLNTGIAISTVEPLKVKFEKRNI
jgi:hypothetical protein